MSEQAAAPDLTAEDLEEVERYFDRTGEVHFEFTAQLIAMARRTAAAEAENKRLKDLEQARYQSVAKALGVVLPSERCTCLYPPQGQFALPAVDPACPVHGARKES